jgi:hypothetical protein
VPGRIAVERFNPVFVIHVSLWKIKNIHQFIKDILQNLCLPEVEKFQRQSHFQKTPLSGGGQVYTMFSASAFSIMPRSHFCIKERSEPHETSNWAVRALIVNVQITFLAGREHLTEQIPGKKNTPDSKIVLIIKNTCIV